jgi:hypothetical protein
MEGWEKVSEENHPKKARKYENNPVNHPGSAQIKTIEINKWIDMIV